jgi:hypothetical protein
VLRKKPAATVMIQRSMSKRHGMTIKSTKREMKNGRLVNWQDAIESQKVNAPYLVRRCSVLTATSRTLQSIERSEGVACCPTVVL